MLPTKPESTMETLFENMLMNEDIKQKLALGQYYDLLQFSEKEEETLKEQFLQAKKHERESLEAIRKDIETEEMTKLTSKQIKQAKVLSKEYREKAKAIGKEAENAVRFMQKRATIAEQRHLEKIQQQIREQHQQKIMEARHLFEERERQYSILEEQEFQERQSWRDELKKKMTTSSTTSTSKRFKMKEQNEEEDEEDDTSSRYVRHHPKKKKQKKVELIMTVDIGDGRVDTIKVHQQDDYEVLARAFQAKHNLVEDVVIPLTAHIQNNIDALRKSKMNQQQDNQQTSLKQQKNPKTPKRRSLAEKQHILNQQNQHVSHKKRYEEERQMNMTMQPKIDKNSRKIVEKKAKKERTQPIHIRLFNQAVELQKKRKDSAKQATEEEQKALEAKKKNTKMSETSRQFAQSRTRGTFQFYGEKLYEEGMKAKQRREEEILLMQEINLVKDENASTFKPDISEYARSRRTDQHIFKRIQAKPNTSRVEALKEENKDAELRDCSFAPSINRNSRAIIKQLEERRMAIGAEHHEMLFRDAERRRIRKQEYENRKLGTFQPNIRPMSASDSLEKENHESFINRLTYSKKQQEEELEKQRDARYKSSGDGQNYFQPRISKASKKRAPPRDGDVYENLYLDRKQHDDERQRLQDKVNEKLKNMATTKRRRDNVEAATARNMRMLFDLLEDPNYRGFIHVPEVDLNGLDPILVQELIVGVFQNASSSYLDFDEFVVLLASHMETSSIPLTSTLRTVNKRATSRRDDDRCTFQPAITKKSSKLAEARSTSAKRSRRYSQSRQGDYYSMLAGEGELWKERAREQKLQEEKEKEKETTTHFVPNGRRHVLSSNDVNELTYRLTTERPRLPHNDLITTDERHYRENCTFKPNLTKSTYKATQPHISFATNLNSSTFR